MKIWCCTCSADVDARLTTGAEIYPHRSDLAETPRWKCDACGNHVGTHHKSNVEKSRTRPLGVIPSKEISNARIHIHNLIDPYWKDAPKGPERKRRRARVYGRLSDRLGYPYHTGEIKTIEQARTIYREAQEVMKEIANG